MRTIGKKIDVGGLFKLIVNKVLKIQSIHRVDSFRSNGSVNLRVFRLNYTANIPEKILGMSRIMTSNRRELLCQKKLGKN